MFHWQGLRSVVILTSCRRLLLIKHWPFLCSVNIFTGLEQEGHSPGCFTSHLPWSTTLVWDGTVLVSARTWWGGRSVPEEGIPAHNSFMGQETIPVFLWASTWNARGLIVALKLTVTSANRHFPKAWAESGFSFGFWQKERANCRTWTLTPDIQDLLAELDQGLAAGSCCFRGKPGLKLALEKQPLFTLKQFFSSSSTLPFPVSGLSCYRWPKFSLSNSVFQMVRSDTGRCVCEQPTALPWGSCPQMSSPLEQGLSLCTRQAWIRKPKQG